MKQKNILITGGAGFIGSNTTYKLLSLGHNVIVVDNFSTGLSSNLYPIENHKNFKFICGNLEKIKPNFIISNKIDTIFHFAAQMSVSESIKNPILDAECNIINSLKLIETCMKSGKNIKFIFSSSGGTVYGETGKINTEEDRLSPISPYGIAKMSIEKYLEFYRNNYKFNCYILRYANVYGENQSIISESGIVKIFMETMSNKNNPTIYGNGEQTRDFVYIDDVVDANCKLIDFYSRNNYIFNIGSGKETTINNLFNKININHFENKFFPTYKNKRSGDLMNSCLNVEKAKKYLKWEPKTDLDNGIRNCYNYTNS